MIDVSIILVTYNHESYVKEALDSILKQRVDFVYEIVFADDCSTDSTKEIIKSYDSVIDNKQYLFSDVNRGNTKNVMNAYLHCNGRYIVTLEGDDYWYSDEKIFTQYHFLEGHKEYIGVSDKRFTIDQNNRRLLSYPLWVHENRETSLEEFLKGKYFSGVETMFRNIFLNKMVDESFIDLFIRDRMIGDLPLCVLLLSLGKVYILNQDFSVYRTSSSGNQNNYNSTLKLLDISKNHIRILNRLSDYFSFDFSYIYAEYFLTGIIGGILSKNVKEIIVIYKLINNNFQRKVILRCFRIFPKILKTGLNKIKNK
jgi:glycosyltransferase involved in cell wall biosynthesis